jgi:hypothetical protein
MDEPFLSVDAQMPKIGGGRDCMPVSIRIVLNADPIAGWETVSWAQF